MIFPFFHGFPNLRSTITWGLVLINIFFYSFYSKQDVLFLKETQTLQTNEYFVQMQGLLFAQIIDHHPQESTKLLDSIAYKARLGKKTAQMSLGQMAFQSSFFNKYSLEQEFVGDKIQYDYWKSKFQSFKSIKYDNPSHIWGVTQRKGHLVSYISYQFVHGSLFHLLSNLWFLLIFGSFLERLLGPLNFLIFYLFSGMIAAQTYIWMTGASEAPLIGASGAISGLMGLVLVLFWKKGIRCFYWILPKEGYYGFVKLPAWIILIIWLGSDISGFVGSLPELSSVAHSAHIGGFFLGILLGLGFYFEKNKIKPQKQKTSSSSF